MCEIQVRTVLQDAWAIVAAHLSYKQESDVPKQLRRKLNALSGLFETADSQFDRLRDERLCYKHALRMQISEHEPDFLKNTINIDNLAEFLKWRLPDREPANTTDVEFLLIILQQYGCTTLSALDTLLQRTYETVKAYETRYPSVDLKTKIPTRFNRSGVIVVALQLADDKSLPMLLLDNQRQEQIREFRPLLKD